MAKDKYGSFHPAFRLRVDELLAARKSVTTAMTETNDQDWMRGQGEYDLLRLCVPLEVNYEQTDAKLEIHAYPFYQGIKFSIGVVACDKMVCRLDYHPDAEHRVPAHSGSPSKLILGAHWHTWELNRMRLSKDFSKLDKLSFAEELDPKVRDYNDALRLYCEHRKIDLNGHSLDLPSRRLL